MWYNKPEVVNLSSIQYTKSLGNFINKIREELLGYSHETFAQLLRTVPSASYYMCGGARKPKETTKKRIEKVSTNRRVDTNYMYKILIMAYDAYLFSTRYDAMTILLNMAKENKQIKAESLEKLFGTKNSIDWLEYNPHQIAIPYEIFRDKYTDKEHKISVSEDGTVENFGDFNMNYREKIFMALKNIFSPKQLPGCIPYLPLVEYEELNTSDKRQLDSFIVELVESEFSKELNDAEKRECRWIYTLYFLHKIVDINPHLEKYINNMYLNNSENKCNWYDVFEKLSRNEYIADANKCTEDFISFKDKNSQITRQNLPVFYYRYKTISGIVKNHPYQEDIDLAQKGKIRLIHLYMILFNIYRSENYSENDAFLKSCYKIGSYGLKVLFDDKSLDLYKPPSSPEIVTNNKNQMAFNSMLSEFFDDAILNPNDEEDMDLLKFRENRNYNASLFMRTISFDFEIIKDLNKGMADELKAELEKTVQRYKKENKL